MGVLQERGVTLGNPRPSCWVVSQGLAGLDNQAVGLAEAVGADWELHPVRFRAPWRWLPPGLRPRPLGAASQGAPFQAPWPDLLISCGRQAVAVAIAVRRASGGRTLTVHIQDPKVSPARFDLVVAPRHDRLRGPNVIVTRGATHRVTPERLSAAARRLAPELVHLARPRVAVLVGGANRRYRLTPDVFAKLAADLKEMAETHGAALMVTPSRRTGPEGEAILRQGLAKVPAVVWDGRGENPYLGYLALADAIVVTADSVSMISEACSTGKPVYVYPLPGGGRRHDRFRRELEAEGVVRAFDGSLAKWRYTPLDDTERAAAAVRERLRARGRAGGEAA